MITQPVKNNRRCECGKGFKILLQYETGKPIPSCTNTVREYERLHGKMSAKIIHE